MNNLGKSFIVGGIIGMAISSMIEPEPMPQRNMSNTIRYGMRKFFRTMTAMKRMM